jgi:hypothetical protein
MYDDFRYYTVQSENEKCHRFSNTKILAVDALHEYKQ